MRASPDAGGPPRLGERGRVQLLAVCPKCGKAAFHAKLCPLNPSNPTDWRTTTMNESETVDLTCKACGHNWTEPKADFLRRFGTGKLGHDCPMGASL